MIQKLEDLEVSGEVTLTVLMVKSFTPLPPSVRVLEEFRGRLDYTYVVNSKGVIQAFGIHTLIQGEAEDIRKWLDENSPVWVGIGSPTMECFEKWSTQLEFLDWELDHLYRHEWPKERKTTGQRRFGQWFVNKFKIEGHSELFYQTDSELAYQYVIQNFCTK
jgi:hypothetical protein